MTPPVRFFTRASRNRSYRLAGAPALQDSAPEPMNGMGPHFGPLMIRITVIALVVVVVGLAIHF